MKYFIYYSNSFNGDYVASILKEQDYQIVKIKMVKSLGKMGFFKMLKLGGDAMFNKKAKIEPIKVKLDPDDNIVIGSPIWNDRLATPINAFLAEYKLSLADTNFILYSASGKANHAYKKLTKLGYENILILKEPKKYREEAKAEILSALLD